MVKKGLNSLGADLGVAYALGRIAQYNYPRLHPSVALRDPRAISILHCILYNIYVLSTYMFAHMRR